MRNADMNIATAHDVIGSFYYNQGRYPEAVAQFTRCLAVGEKALGEEHFRHAAAHNHLGTVFFRLGDVEAALHHNRRSLAIEVASLGGAHPDVVHPEPQPPDPRPQPLNPRPKKTNTKPPTLNPERNLLSRVHATTLNLNPNPKP